MPETACNLSDCFLCRSCLPEWKSAIGTKKKTIQFKKGQQVFHENDKVEGIFFVYSGSVKVYKKWTANKELILRFARAGDVLGHRGLGDDIYPVSARTLEEARLCFITNDFLDASLKINPNI